MSGNFARFCLLSLLIVTVLAGAIPAHQARATTELGYEPGQVVVRLAADFSGTIDLINETYGTATLGSIYGRNDTYLLGALDGTSAETLVKLMSADPRLAYAELNYVTENPEAGSTDRIYGWGGEDSQPYHNQDWREDLQLEQAHDYSQGHGVMVAVLDTGLQRDHPELSASLHSVVFDFVDNDPFPDEEANQIDEDGDGQIDEGYGHGTHVAGITHLIAPETLLMPLRVLNSEGRGNNFKTASAIRFAAYNGADVINLSLGTAYPSSLLRDVIAEVATMGVVVVAAAGNLDNEIPQYPAAEPCAIGVTSINSKDKKSDFGSYGAWVNVDAPGEAIYSTFPMNGYAWWSGTSMATPFVSGQAALLRSAEPSVGLHSLGQLIGGTAQPLDQINPLYKGLLGQGKLNLATSLEALAENSWSTGRDVLGECESP